MTNYSTNTVAQLRGTMKIYVQQGHAEFRGYSKMRKVEMVDLLTALAVRNAKAAASCMSRFTTVKGEHWCSVTVSIDSTAHEGPCVEITERWGAVENTIWAAMKSNAHLIRPSDETAERENELCPPVCAHGKTADQGCLESPCSESVDSAHPVALRLDEDRTIYLWVTDVPESQTTDWNAVAEYSTRREHFTPEQWTKIARRAADDVITELSTR